MVGDSNGHEPAVAVASSDVAIVCGTRSGLVQLTPSDLSASLLSGNDDKLAEQAAARAHKSNDQVVKRGYVQESHMAWEYNGSTQRLNIHDARDGSLKFTVTTTAEPAEATPDTAVAFWTVDDILHVRHDCCILLMTSPAGDSQLCWLSIATQSLSVPITLPCRAARVVVAAHGDDSGVLNAVLGIAASTGTLYELSVDLPEDLGWYFDLGVDIPISTSSLVDVASLESDEAPAHLSFSAQLNHYLLIGQTNAAFARSRSLGSGSSNSVSSLSFTVPPSAPGSMKAVAFENKSDEYMSIVLCFLDANTNAPQLQLYEASAADVRDLGINPLSGASFTANAIATLGVQSACVHSNSLVFCGFALSHADRTEVMVFVLDDDKRISTPYQPERWTYVYTYDTVLSSELDLSVAELSVRVYKNKHCAERAQPHDEWQTPISFSCALYSDDGIESVQFNGLQQHALELLSTFGVAILCDCSAAYNQLANCGLVAGTATTEEQKRNSILEVLMLNGLTGVVSAYAKYLNHEAALAMPRRDLQPHDTLASLWAWLMDFWLFYETRCKTLFVEYLNGASFTATDVQPILAILASLDKVFGTLSRSSGSQRSLSSLHRQHLLVQDCHRLFRVIAWFEERGLHEHVSCENSFIVNLALGAVPNAEEKHFNSPRAFLSLKLPMNTLALTCLYRMAMNAPAGAGESFANALLLPRFAKSLVKGIVLLDQKHYEQALSALSQADVEVFTHQHAEFVALFLREQSLAAAFKYLRSHESGIHPSSFVGVEHNVMVEVLFKSSQLPLCFSRIHQALQQGYAAEGALAYLFDLCFQAQGEHQARAVASLLNLPFDACERALFEAYLAERTVAGDHYAKDVFVVFLLQTSRIYDAMLLHRATMPAAIPANRREKHASLSVIISSYKHALPRTQQRTLLTYPTRSAEEVISERFLPFLHAQPKARAHAANASNLLSISYRPPRNVAVPPIAAFQQRSHHAPSPRPLAGETSTASRVPAGDVPSFLKESFMQPPTTPMSQAKKVRSRMVWSVSTPASTWQNDISFAQLDLPEKVGASPSLLLGTRRRDEHSFAESTATADDSLATVASNTSSILSQSLVGSAAARKQMPQADRRKDNAEDEDDDDDDEITVNLPMAVVAPPTTASPAMSSSKPSPLHAKKTDKHPEATKPVTEDLATPPRALVTAAKAALPTWSPDMPSPRSNTMSKEASLPAHMRRLTPLANSPTQQRINSPLARGPNAATDTASTAARDTATHSHASSPSSVFTPSHSATQLSSASPSNPGTPATPTSTAKVTGSVAKTAMSNAMQRSKALASPMQESPSLKVTGGQHALDTVRAIQRSSLQRSSVATPQRHPEAANNAVTASSPFASVAVGQTPQSSRAEHRAVAATPDASVMPSFLSPHLSSSGARLSVASQLSSRKSHLRATPNIAKPRRRLHDSSRLDESEDDAEGKSPSATTPVVDQVALSARVDTSIADSLSSPMPRTSTPPLTPPPPPGDAETVAQPSVPATTSSPSSPFRRPFTATLGSPASTRPSPSVRTPPTASLLRQDQEEKPEASPRQREDDGPNPTVSPAMKVKVTPMRANQDASQEKGRSKDSPASRRSTHLPSTPLSRVAMAAAARSNTLASESRSRSTIASSTGSPSSHVPSISVSKASESPHPQTPQSVFSPPTTRLSQRRKLRDARQARETSLASTPGLGDTLSASSANLSFATTPQDDFAFDDVGGNESFSQSIEDDTSTSFADFASPIPTLPVSVGVLTRSQSRPSKNKSRIDMVRGKGGDGASHERRSGVGEGDVKHAATTKRSKLVPRGPRGEGLVTTADAARGKPKTRAKRRTAKSTAHAAPTAGKVKHGMSLRRSARKKK